MDQATPPELDSRFIQANERTLLAWIRTSLALVTFGFVVARLGSWLNLVGKTPEPPALLSTAALGSCFIALALVVNVLALIRYQRVLNALRRGQGVPVDRLPFLFGCLLVILSAAVAVYTSVGGL
jgi:putative membrane protein